MLILNDGRISIGTCKDDNCENIRNRCIIIYDQNTYKEDIIINGLGPCQIQLKNNNLLVSYNGIISII